MKLYDWAPDGMLEDPSGTYARCDDIEAAIRDAALWREWWPRLERAIAQAVHPCERCGLVVIADQLRTTLAAAREAAGKEDGR